MTAATSDEPFSTNAMNRVQQKENAARRLHAAAAMTPQSQRRHHVPLFAHRNTIDTPTSLATPRFVAIRVCSSAILHLPDPMREQQHRERAHFARAENAMCACEAYFCAKLIHAPCCLPRHRTPGVPRLPRWRRAAQMRADACRVRDIEAPRRSMRFVAEIDAAQHAAARPHEKKKKKKKKQRTRKTFSQARCTKRAFTMSPDLY